MRKPMLIALITAATSVPAVAAEKTVVLSVPGMNCAACPITVRKALQKVAGVSAVKTTLDALTRATADAGYPSALKQ